MKRRVVALVTLLVVGLAAVRAGEGHKRPMTVDDLFQVRRVSEPQISPDGQTIAYVMTTADVAGNRLTSTLWLVPTGPGPDGAGQPRQLTTTTKRDRHPRWSPDGNSLLFESNRSGENQLWVIPIAGGEARQLTSISTGAGTGIWSPDGKSIAFVSAVYPEYSDKPFAESNALNKKRRDAAEKNPVKARVFSKLFFRHWNDWVEDKRLHLFVMPAAGGQPRDLTPGDRDAYPTSHTFSIGDDFTFTPDSQAIVFTAPPEHGEAWTTNYDLWRVPVTGGKAECLTSRNPAADGGPRFSPDGKTLAYRAQRRPGFEADRWELMVAGADGAGSPRSITADFDGSPQDYVWKPDGTGLYFTADDHGEVPLFFADLTSGRVTKVQSADRHARASLSAARNPRGRGGVAYIRAALNRPPEAHVLADTETERSHANAELLAQLDLPAPESVTVKGASGTPMQMWILRPPGFDPARKWPLAFLVHGGPQGAWEDNWSFRWNASLWAAQGYVVALPNPRGSTGFGQKYVDEISGDWGGKCFEDLMAGLAHLKSQPYIDPERMAAAGASFGGYMMNWFEGHTDQFKTLISHCGVYNFESMYATTDELWFDEWEHGGPPWGERRESYEKHSPHRFARDFKTPMLIIQNDLDFRVPVSEGLQLFTTLQRKGVPSKMINFPDEGHWVLKPANSKYWHREVFAWLAKYAPPGGR